MRPTVLVTLLVLVAAPFASVVADPGDVDASDDPNEPTPYPLYVDAPNGVKVGVFSGTLAEGDQDWYRFTQAADDVAVIDVEVNGEGIDLVLLDGDGEAVEADRFTSGSFTVLQYDGLIGESYTIGLVAPAGGSSDFYQVAAFAYAARDWGVTRLGVETVLDPATGLDLGTRRIEVDVAFPGDAPFYEPLLRLTAFDDLEGFRFRLPGDDAGTEVARFTVADSPTPGIRTYVAAWDAIGAGSVTLVADLGNAEYDPDPSDDARSVRVALVAGDAPVGVALD